MISKSVYTCQLYFLSSRSFFSPSPPFPSQHDSREQRKATREDTSSQHWTAEDRFFSQQRIPDLLPDTFLRWTGSQGNDAIATPQPPPMPTTGKQKQARTTSSATE